jgi:hypothetical protein
MSDNPGGNNGGGYGKPPVATRFSKGRSGNPKGRPKGSRNVASVLDEVIREKVRVTENGKVRAMTKLEAMMRQLMTKALSGDLKAMKEVVALKHLCEAITDQTRQQQPDTEKNEAIMRRLVERLRATQSTDDNSAEPAVKSLKRDEVQ